MKNIFKKKKSQIYLFELLLFFTLIYFFFILFKQASSNLLSQGVASGFSFLNRESGFSILQTLKKYNEESTYLDVFYVGILNTLLVLEDHMD